MKRFTRIVTLLLVCSMTIFMACEGPQGPEGPQGQQGQQGPVGPAGEDGSMMYSGQGAPDASTGETGDYYLDTDTGELYGPKDDSGWGNPIMVLEGEDGEDGSQIYAGSGAPDASLGDLGDFYLDQANYDMYGPKTENGWGSPINLKGADGNANVTRYIYPGHDFSSNTKAQLIVNNLSDQQEMHQSAWLVYLVDTQTYNDVLYFSVPGKAVIATYSVDHFFSTSNSFGVFEIFADQQGTEFQRLELVRIEASNTEDQTKQKSDAILPSGLDTSDYKAVSEYYGFYR